MAFPADVRSQTLDIAQGDQESNAIYRGNNDLVGLKIPADFVGGYLTFKVGDEEDDLGGYLWEGQVFEVAVAAGRNVSIDPGRFAAWPWIAIVSGSVETAVGGVSVTPKLRGF